MGGLPTTFWWLWAGAFVNALGTFVFPFLALFLTGRGLRVQDVGLIVALFGGGSIVSGPIAGFMADRFGRRPTLVLALAVTGVATAPLGVFSSPRAIALGVLGIGVVSNAFRPVLNAVIADVVAPGERGRAFGLVYWANNLGMAISLIVGGVLASYGYERLFLADAATTILFAALVWWKVAETRPAQDTHTAPAGGGGYGAILADRALMAFLAVNLVFLVVFFQFQVAAPVDMARHGLGPAGFGRVLAVNGILIAILQPLSARLVPRFDAAHVLAGASVLVATGYGAYALCNSARQYAAATALWTLGEILALPAASAVVANLSPEALRGRYQGAFSMSFGIGMSAAPVLGGSCMQHFGAPILWAACFTLGLAVAGSHLLIAGARRQRLAASVRLAPA